jgi:hypothetical protein
MKWKISGFQRFNANVDPVSGWRHYVDVCRISSVSEILPMRCVSWQFKANANPISGRYHDVDTDCIATVLEIVSNFKVKGMYPPHRSLL